MRSTDSGLLVQFDMFVAVVCVVQFCGFYQARLGQREDFSPGRAALSVLVDTVLSLPRASHIVIATQ